MTNSLARIATVAALSSLLSFHAAAEITRLEITSTQPYGTFRAGNYTITFSDKYQRVLDVGVNVVKASGITLLTGWQVVSTSTTAVVIQFMGPTDSTPDVFPIVAMDPASDESVLRLNCAATGELLATHQLYATKHIVLERLDQLHSPCSMYQVWRRSCIVAMTNGVDCCE
jgi:hypothetical protein